MTQRAGEDPSKAPRALEKAAFVARLSPTKQELDKIVEKYEKATKSESTKRTAGATKAIKWIKTISSHISNTGKFDVLRDANIFSDIETDTLVFIAQNLIQGREGVLSAKELEHQYSLLKAFKENMSVECVGYLHLERLNYAPGGIEKGELVYSVPLSPGEEVNIKHREWSHITEEFERIVTDYLEEFSEEGVTEKTELAQTVNSQAQHSSALNTGVTASGSYGPISITTTVGYNASESDSNSTQLTRNESADLTRKASSRAKKEHKISFRVASAAETEDETVQRIKNPFSDRATRVDYYKLVRKWRIDLYRYGMRLTWDMVIPEPGSALLSKVLEIHEIQEKLNIPFEKTFDLSPQEIGLNNYIELAHKYNVNVTEPAPLASMPISETFSYDWSCDKPNFQEVLEVEIPEGYEINSDNPALIIMWTKRCGTTNWSITYRDLITGDSIAHHYKEDDQEFLDKKEWRKWNGRTGKVGIHIYTWKTMAATVHITIDAAISENHFNSWKQRIWNMIHDGAKANYYEERQSLKNRLAMLEEELGAQDALSLRKKEREEVMRGVLEAFGLSLADEDYRNPKLIRFVHHALEWENMLYFLYPYFWSDPNKEVDSSDQQEPYWEFKKYLDHPDPMHRAFLKAGAARVVIPVRPGFEDAFLAFVNGRDIEDLPPAPYLEISREFEAYAKTNYPGMPPANPVKNYRPLLSRKQQKTWNRMQLMMRLLEVYRRVNGRFPSSEEGLAVLRDSFPFKDPWGHEYLYIYPGAHAEFDLSSYGADGIESDDDITNWEPGRYKNSPAEVMAFRDIELISLLLEEYRKLHGTYPENLSGLQELIPLKDAWDNDFHYQCPGEYLDYDLVSYGADGKPGGENEDADITNWAEASLIGQWFEYTPTSALDIAFDEEIPKI